MSSKAQCNYDAVEQYCIFYLIEMCPGQDLNLHDLAVTSPSSWRVYQFHHLGNL